MTGAQMLTYLKRRLALVGVSVETTGPFGDGVLYDYITHGRDVVLGLFSLEAPKVVRTLVSLELASGSSDRIYKIPDAQPDPYRWLELRPIASETYLEEPLRPSAVLDVDLGEIEVISLRQCRIADNVNVSDGLEAYVVVAGADIDQDTTEAQVGLPTPCHRAAVLWAAVLALTQDEDNDATNAVKVYEAELARLTDIYADFFEDEGASLWETMLAGYGEQYSDLLY